MYELVDPEKPKIKSLYTIILLSDFTPYMVYLEKPLKCIDILVQTESLWLEN